MLTDTALPATRIELLQRLAAALTRRDATASRRCSRSCVTVTTTRTSARPPSRVLDSAAFQVARFRAHRRAYDDALRDLVGDPVPTLRKTAVTTLARERDPAVQRILFDGLQDGGELPVDRELAVRRPPREESATPVTDVALRAAPPAAPDVTPSGTATDLGALVDALRTKPDGAERLAALLPENLPLHAGRSAAEMTRFRGYVLATFADTGLPRAAMPSVVESLEAGHGPDEVAGAAIGLRGIGTAPVDVVMPLLRAIDNWPAPTARSASRRTGRRGRTRGATALTEVVRTIGLLGERARPAVARLADLAGQRDRFPAALREEKQRVVDAAAADSGCRGSGTCACCARPDPAVAARPADENLVAGPRGTG